MTETSTYYTTQEPGVIVGTDSLLSREEMLFFASIRMLLNNQLIQPATGSVEHILGFSKTLKEE